MGALLACCSSVESGLAKDRNDFQGLTSPDPQSPNVKLSPAQLEAFRERLEASIAMIVVIADGKKIPCRLRWSPTERALVMSCDVNNHLHIRRMPLSELASVIHGPRDLGRVATKANIVDDPTCVALHLTSNTCIPICFENSHDKQCFIQLIAQLNENM